VHLNPIRREATVIKPGPTTTFSPIATIVILGPHAMMLDCDAMNRPDTNLINKYKKLYPLI